MSFSGDITMVDIPTLLIAGALLGAGLNVIRGVAQSDEGFNIKKATGAAIAATIAALATVSIFDVSVLGGPIQTITLGLLAGFGADYSLSRLNK
jgi:hypothetical protein|tara:strand:+ start:3069 stop:3350 length:282 start_codon:yes stop_codon:yes gene_type:complete